MFELCGAVVEVVSVSENVLKTVICNDIHVLQIELYGNTKFSI